jgi:hypothetical protein
VLTSLTKSASAILLICTEYFCWDININVYSRCPELECRTQDLSFWRSIFLISLRSISHYMRRRRWIGHCLTIRILNL